MSVRSTASADAVVESAIAELLATERAAREAVAQSHHDAATLLEAARGRARDIVQRAEGRMARARAAYDRRTEESLAELAATAASIARQDVPDEADRLRLKAAVAALAARLTGGAQ